MKITVKQTLPTILAIMSFAGIVWGAQSYLYTNYASATDLKKIEKRLDTKILEDRLSGVQDRIWKIEDRHYKQIMSKDAVEQIRTLNTEKDKIEKELNKIYE